jgi:hypothetical protein
VDNTGGGTDIVLTNTVEDDQMDVVTSSDDSITHTQRTTTTDDGDGTPMVETPTNDDPKPGETPTDAQISTPAECEVKAVNAIDACVAEWDDSPRCSTTTNFWDFQESSAEAWEVAEARAKLINDEFSFGYGRLVQISAWAEPGAQFFTEGCYVGEYGYNTCGSDGVSGYRGRVTVQDCGFEEHTDQCRGDEGEAAVAYEQCMAVWRAP